MLFFRRKGDGEKAPKPTEHRLAYLPSSTGLPDNLRGKSLGFARYLAWVVLVLVLVLTAVLSTYIGNAARTTLLGKQQQFATLLAENLNHQIDRRFTLPTLLGFGTIALRQPAQFERLDQVVQSTTHGLHVETLRIFGHDNTITYSTNRDELGTIIDNKDFLEKAALMDGPTFIIDATMPYWQAFFRFPLEPKTFILRTTYPLRIENRLNSSTEDGPLMGVLEFTQDISGDMESVFRFQQLVTLITLCTSVLLFVFLLFFIRRAERAMEELHNNEKLVAMGRVVASIAHEIRNPLGIIRSSAELLLKRSGTADTSTSRILQAVYDESKRLSQTVSDFLDFAKPHPKKDNPVDMGSLITQALAFLESELTTRDISVVRVGQLDTPLITLGDKELLYRAVYNILSNGLQAAGVGGTLSITQTVDSPANKHVVLSFHDSGSGFSPEALDKILDPFFTTKDGGTGLGLPIVNNIITNHGGKLTFANAPEGGALVTVRLRLAS